jgi:hypothetical protein
MDIIIAQAGNLNAEWIIGGLASAFCAFAIWVGKFLKQIWGDVKTIWIEFKDMHKKKVEALDAVILKQDESNGKAHERTTKILSKTLEIERHVHETKFCVLSFQKELDTMKIQIVDIEGFYEKLKSITADNFDDFLRQLRDQEGN